MDRILFEQLEEKYGRCARWSVWNPHNPVDTACIRHNVDSLTTSVVMVALNLSRFVPQTWQNFHSRDHARKLMYAFNRSPYRGAYMTDLIKGEIDPSAAALSQRMRNGTISVGVHVRAFCEEMRHVGVRRETLFILFGKRVTDLFVKHLASDYPNHISCRHYSNYGKGYTDAEWVSNTWQILEACARRALDSSAPEFVVTDEMRNDLLALERSIAARK